MLSLVCMRVWVWVSVGACALDLRVCASMHACVPASPGMRTYLSIRACTPGAPACASASVCAFARECMHAHVWVHDLYESHYLATYLHTVPLYILSYSHLALIPIWNNSAGPVIPRAMIRGILTFSDAFLFFLFVVLLFWKLDSVREFKFKAHFILVFFLSKFLTYSNLTKCILVLQQLQRKERINTLRIFIYKPRSAPMEGLRPPLTLLG